MVRDGETAGLRVFNGTSSCTSNVNSHRVDAIWCEKLWRPSAVGEAVTVSNGGTEAPGLRVFPGR